MPFTFSHPAIILPLRKFHKYKFSITGLVLGSITPDFEAFITFNDHKQYSHTWIGILWFDLPITILYSFVFHNITRNMLIDNLPDYLKQKFYRFKYFNWNSAFKNNYSIVILSMLIGITSHLIWDSITHLNFANPHGFDSETNTTKILISDILQYSSSVAGLIACCITIYRIPSNPKQCTLANSGTNGNSKNYSDLLYWIQVAIFDILVVYMALTRLKYAASPIFIINAMISGLLVAITFIPIIHKVLLPQKSKLIPYE